MDISGFICKAQGLGVLGVKVSQNNEIAAEWKSEDECRRNVYSEIFLGDYELLRYFCEIFALRQM